MGVEILREGEKLKEGGGEGGRKRGRKGRETEREGGERSRDKTEREGRGEIL